MIVNTFDNNSTNFNNNDIIISVFHSLLIFNSMNHNFQTYNNTIMNSNSQIECELNNLRLNNLRLAGIN